MASIDKCHFEICFYFSFSLTRKTPGCKIQACVCSCVVVTVIFSYNYPTADAMVTLQYRKKRNLVFYWAIGECVGPVGNEIPFGCRCV